MSRQKIFEVFYVYKVVAKERYFKAQQAANVTPALKILPKRVHSILTAQGENRDLS